MHPRGRIHGSPDVVEESPEVEKEEEESPFF
jgi:hypothetical protein